MLSFLRRQWYRWYTKKQLNEELFDVADIAVAQDLLVVGADLKACNQQGDTSFIYACKQGYLEIAQFFLQCGADINARNKKNKTALFYACQYGYEDIVRFLLQSGVSPNISDRNEWTPLMVAARNGNSTIVRLLLDFQADPDFRNNENKTALMFAAAENHLEVAEFLLKNNANVDIVSEEQFTALMYAAQLASAEMVRLFFMHKPTVDANFINVYGNTALIIAAASGNKETVEELCLCGADYNLCDYDGLTALLYAAEHERIEVVEYLLTLQNIIVNNPNEEEMTALEFFECDTRAKIEKKYNVIESMLREKGCLEYHVSNMINNPQSVHDERTKISAEETIKKLSENKDEIIINEAYQDFVRYLDSALFEQDIASIANKSFGEGAVKTILKDMTTQERINFLRYEIKGTRQHLGYIQRINNPQNSYELKQKFKKVAGLVWLATKEAAHLFAIQHLYQNGVALTEAQLLEVLIDVRQTLCKGILSICCEFFNAGKPQAEQEEYSACPEGVIHYHLAILNKIHDKVCVSHQPLEYIAPIDGILSIKEILLIKGYEGLEKLLKAAFMGRTPILHAIVDGLAVEGCSEDTFRSFLENTNQFPRSLLLQKTLEMFLGYMKKTFEPKTKEGYCGLEMALMQVPYSELITILHNMLPKKNIVIEPALVLSVKEQVIIGLHAYIDHKLKLLDESLLKVSSEALGPIGERMVQLKFKKYRLPIPRHQKSWEGDLLQQLENLFLDPKNAWLREDPMFLTFKDETELKRCFISAEKRTHDDGQIKPAVTPIVSFSPVGSVPAAGSAEMRALLLSAAEKRRRLNPSGLF